MFNPQRAIEPPTCAITAFAALFILLLTTTLHAVTWVGGTTDWNTAANWNPAGVPNSASTPVVFGDVGVGIVNISTSVSVQSITFNNTNTFYTLTSGANQTLSGVTSITISANGATTNQINLAPVATGNLLFPSGNLTITNNSPTFAGISINAIIGTPGNGGVVFNGAGITNFAGSFASNAIGTNVIGGLTKAGPGRLIYDGDGTNLLGGLTLSGGILVLDYAGSPASKMGSSGALTLNGGTFEISTNAGVTQTIPGGTLIGAGHTDLFAFSGGVSTLAAGNISRSAGATADFALSNFAVTTPTTNTNGLFGTGPAYATVNGGASWAMSTGGSIGAVTVYGNNSYTSGTNTDDISLSTIIPGNFTTNSLRFNNNQNPVITITNTLTLQSGGILVPPAASAGAQITGGTLTATGGGELIFHVYGPNLEIFSNVVSSAGLTKTGPGLLLLSTASPGLTGPVNVNRGDLEVLNNTSAVNSASQINFNDNRTGTQQQFIIDLNFTSGTITPNIRVTDFNSNVADDYGTQFTTGTSSNSTVTLSGVISSPAGITTPIRFNAKDNTSGFNLTGINTFTGNISVTQGTLGINSDASLGNGANTLFLEVNSATAGGLIFLNTGITVSHAIVLNSNTRIVSNGTDSNTISGVISGPAMLFKDGTGTLTLSNSNSFLGGMQITAGTLLLTNNSALSAGSTVFVQPGAVLNPGTTTGEILGGLILDGAFRPVTGGSGSIVVVGIVGDAGSTIDLTNAGAYTFKVGSVTITGNSSWVSAANSATVSAFGSPIGLTILPGVILSNGIALAGPGVIVTGGGTLFQNSDATNVLGMSAPVTVKAATTFRVSDASSHSGVGNLGTGTFTLDGGTFEYSGTANTTSKIIAITANNGTIQIDAGSTLTVSSVIGAGALSKTGTGILVLTNSGNTFSSLTINAGTVQTANDAALGANPTIAVNAAGNLTYTASLSTARTFNLNSGTLQSASGAVVTLSGTANGGFLRGPGTFALASGGALNGVTTFNSTTINQTSVNLATNFSNGGTLNVNGFMGINGGTNAASGTINVNLFLDATDFSSDGIINIPKNGLVNAENTLTLGGGARMFIGTKILPGGSLTLLNGATLEVNGALLVNDGTITGTTNVNYGGQANGIGTYGTVNVSFGGVFQPGFASNVLVGNGAAVAALSGNGTIDNATAGGNMQLAINGGASSFSGPIQNTIGTLSLFVQGTSSLTLLTSPLSGGGTTTNTYAGGTSIAAGATVIIGAAGALPAGGTVANNGAFIVNANSISGQITGHGALTIGTAAPATLTLASAAGASITQSLSIASGSKLDLTNDSLIVQSTADKLTTLLTLAGQIKSGRNGGLWNGSGIISTSVAADPLHYDVGLFDNALLNKSLIGNVALDTTAAIVATALIGDANFDASVNSADLTLILNNWNSHTATNWAMGDLNNDGIVDSLDVRLVLNHWTDTAFAPQINFTPGFSYKLIPVPEPASLLFFTLAGTLTLLRRPVTMRGR